MKSPLKNQVESGHQRWARTPRGTIRVPSIELTEQDADLFEQWAIDNDFPDIRIALRTALMGAVRDPRWAGLVSERRRSNWLFRTTLYERFQLAMQQIQQETTEDLLRLVEDAEARTRRNPADENQT